MLAQGQYALLVPQLNALGSQLNVVCMPDVRIYPAEDLQVLCQHHIEFLSAITDIVTIFRQMNIHRDTVLTASGADSFINSRLTETGEHGATTALSHDRRRDNALFPVR